MNDSENISDLLIENLREIEAGGFDSVPSGFVELDCLTSGWQKSELIVVAGRPGMGKTCFALSCVLNAAIQFNKPVAVFSLEMSSAHLINRFISIQSDIELKKIRRGTLEQWEWQLIHSKIADLEQSPIIIDVTPNLDILEFKQKCYKLKEDADIQLIVVDYIQLMVGKGGDGKGIGDRWQEIGSISRALKSIAKELNVPVIALSQLSRAVENRPSGSKRPMLSDLAESGSIEQDADMVLFIYRPEYYGLDVDEDNNPTHGVGEVIVSKHRNGETGRVRLRFKEKYGKFENLDETNDNVSKNAFQNFNPSSDFFIRPSRMDDMDDEAPF